MKKCKVENCNKKYYAKGYCRKHYRLATGEHKKRYIKIMADKNLYKKVRKSQIKYVNRVKNEEWFKNAHNERQRKYYYKNDRRKRYLRKWKEDLLFGGNRERVLNRDNYTCQHCGMSNEEHFAKYNRALTIHHINHLGLNVKYQQKDNRLENLITLCMSCHSKEDKKSNG